jgi:hypothetical protein
MYKEVSLSDTEIQLDKKQVSSLLETAETIRANALKLARKKLRLREQDGELANLFERRDFVEYFKHALALEVSQVIATYDQRVQAVYLFDESANPDADTEDYPSFVDLTIHLLALVTSASAALEAFVNSLDRTLTEVLSELPSNAFARRTSFLNVIPINESDIDEGRGYAVLLSSIYARPLKIWQRD